MLEQVKDEQNNMMLYDQLNDVTKQMDIVNKTNKLLNDEYFEREIKLRLDKFYNQPSGLSLCDLSQIILDLQSVIPKFENTLNLYRGLDIIQMKFILYGCIYHYICKNQPKYFEKVLIGEFRLEYNNIFNLIEASKKSYELESRLFLRIYQWFCEKLSCMCSADNARKIRKIN